MLRASLAQMRLHLRRLIAAGVAVLIATTFVTATLLSTDVMERTVHNAILAGHGDADVIVTGSPTKETLDDVRAVPGVAGADGRQMNGITLSTGTVSDHQAASAVPETPGLRVDVTRGQHPDSPGDVIVAEPVAERLGLEVGSSIDVIADRRGPDEGAERMANTVTVTGIFPDPGAAFDSSIPGVFAHPEDIDAWSASSDEGTYLNIGVVAGSETSPDELRESVASSVGDSGVQVRTAEEYAADVAASFTSDAQVLVAVLMGFGAIALFTAGMVISNTFAVVVAQRTRELALLRCVGATRRQIRRGILAEAGVLGVVTSVAGVGAGIGLTQILVQVLGRLADMSWIPDGINIAASAIALPLLLGTLVTLIAALWPARAATRIAPLAALRMPASLMAGQRTSTRRWVSSALLVAIGAGLLAVGVAASDAGSVGLGIGVGVLGGAVSFLGILLGTVVLVPLTVAVLGRAVRRFSGVPARMAVVNVLRHPGRTAATAASLLIGVTLVATVSVGVSSAQASALDELDQRYPVDVAVGYSLDQIRAGETDTAAFELSTGVTEAVRGVDGVTTAIPLRGARLEASSAESENPARADVSVQGVDPDAARDVARSDSGLEELRPGKVALSAVTASQLGLERGDRMRLGSDAAEVELEVVSTEFRTASVLVTDDDLADLVPDAPGNVLWLGLDATADPAEVIRDIEDAVSAAAGGTTAPAVAGAAAERAEFERVLDMVLAVMTGLLAVTVVIALVGVGNTLSLSVIERARESATLRALGLTRRQLRSMLVMEGALIAIAGAVLGILLGLAYGLVGALTAVGGTWSVTFSVPWGRVIAIVVVVVLAGMIASVLPGRRAATEPPVVALATE
ncbi:FtsX-like permease family protein [Actinobacteria bacterium YIM 96077]|uniref:ABC transporter permease n=1 Tax=Phytoactinopolyspora halophila TaxID=1981511 RepID=A0A329R4N3_9ACTN|nr:FtsX-like permease family protein [Phytoactinopolyspora halophila]AYY11440.1 FtsX-like permease family protein [Actinobacteria bacterium YIM 96077]RAW18078.1 ABC transporter permease [Phytoactinopolyspora halophila]